MIGWRGLDQAGTAAIMVPRTSPGTQAMDYLAESMHRLFLAAIDLPEFEHVFRCVSMGRSPHM